MAKSREAFRTISEVSDTLKTPTHVLRFWESKFSQIKPVKRAGGRRYYRPDDIDLLAGIKTLLHDHGMTIKGAQKLLREQGVKHVMAIATQGSDSVIAESVSSGSPPSAAEKPSIESKPAEPIKTPDVVEQAPARITILTEVAAPNQLMVKANAAKIAALLAQLEKLRDTMRVA